MANVTITKKADATGCPVFSNGAPGLPVTIQEPSGGSLVTCYLRPASSLYAGALTGSVVFPEAEIPARRNADEFPGGHVRTTAEQAADAAAVAAQVTDDAKLATARTVLQNYLDAVRAIAAGSRTPEQRAIYALAKIVVSRE